MDILDILTRESENSSKVYLYEENGQWCAYERSARLVRLIMLNKAKIAQVNYEQYQIIIDRAELDLSRLIYYPIVSCSDHEIIIDLHAFKFSEEKELFTWLYGY